VLNSYESLIFVIGVIVGAGGMAMIFAVLLIIQQGSKKKIKRYARVA